MGRRASALLSRRSWVLQMATVEVGMPSSEASEDVRALDGIENLQIKATVRCQAP